MIGEFSSMIEAMQDPAMRHAVLVHAPIALAMLLVLAVFAALLIGHRVRALNWGALVIAVLLVGTSLFAKLSGEDAHAEVVADTTDVQEVLAEHESMGDVVWLFALGMVVAIVISVAMRGVQRVGVLAAAMALAVVTAGWVAVTAHHGGTLVYAHGVGVQVAAPEAVEPPAVALTPEELFFREVVHPILAENCFRCHNPSGQDRAAGLDLTSREALLAGGLGGPIVELDDPEASFLLTVVRWEEPDLEMPPDDDQLSAESIAALAKWLADGAVWSTPDR